MLESAIRKSNSTIFGSVFYKLKNSQREVSKDANVVAIRRAETSHAEQEILAKHQEIAEDITSAAKAGESQPRAPGQNDDL
jgi:hypothetical protein